MYNVFLSSAESYNDINIDIFIKSFLEKNPRNILNSKKILIKPNLLQASVPEKAVTTHPNFVKKVVEKLRECTSAEILLGDSPGANSNYDRVAEVTGIKGICNELGIELIKIEKYTPVTKGEFICSSIVDNVDTIVNLPKLKTHSLTGLTIAVKNLFGLIPGLNKVNFHRKYPDNADLGRAIYRFYKTVEDKSIHIMDGIYAHQGDGPSRGSPVQKNIIAASECGWSLDFAITKMLGFELDFCKTNLGALEEGLSCGNIDIVHSLRSIYDTGKLKIPLTMRYDPPKVIKQWLSNKIYVKPRVIQDKCIGCLLCLKSCPAYAITVQAKKAVIDKSKCVECFCCHEVCESDAIELERSIIHRMIIR